MLIIVLLTLLVFIINALKVFYYDAEMLIEVKADLWEGETRLFAEYTAIVISIVGMIYYGVNRS